MCALLKARTVAHARTRARHLTSRSSSATWVRRSRTAVAAHCSFSCLWLTIASSVAGVHQNYALFAIGTASGRRTAYYVDPQRPFVHVRDRIPRPLTHRLSAINGWRSEKESCLCQHRSDPASLKSEMAPAIVVVIGALCRVRYVRPSNRDPTLSGVSRWQQIPPSVSLSSQRPWSLAGGGGDHGRRQAGGEYAEAHARAKRQASRLNVVTIFCHKLQSRM